MKSAAPQFVYFIRPIGQAGPVKIGCSACPPARLEGLMAWSPFPLEIVATVPGNFGAERRIHCLFAPTHSHREWFHPSQALTDFIAQLSAGAALADLINLSGKLPKFRDQRRHYSTERRLYLSYSSRVRWASKKLRARGDDTAWHEPRDIEGIIGLWNRGTQPSAAQIARLDEYLAAPADHSIVPTWRIRSVAPSQAVAA